MMIANNDFKLNVFEETLNLADFKGFLETLRSAISELSTRAPRDGFITVDVTRMGGGYRVAIKLASKVLTFLEEGDGRSPFFALENVLLKANSALKVWSINRKF